MSYFRTYSYFSVCEFQYGLKDSIVLNSVSCMLFVVQLLSNVPFFCDPMDYCNHRLLWPWDFSKARILLWRLAFSPLWDLPDPGLEPMFPALKADSSSLAPPGKYYGIWN